MANWRDEPFRRLVEGVRDYAIVLLDPEGRVTTWNLGAERITGYRAEEILGRHIEVFYPKSAVEKRWAQHELETASRLGRFEDEGWRLRSDGSRVWVNVVITTIRDESGRLLGYSKVMCDITERRENEDRLRQSEERFRLMVEGVQDYAIFMLDPTGHVVSWNEGAQRIKGYTAAEIIGKHFSTFYTDDAIERGWPAHELDHATRLGRFEDEGWRVRKDGTRFWANVVISALRDQHGNLRGFSKITRDLTERRRQEERLRESEARFRLLLDGIEDYAVCMLDPEGRVTSWNSGAERITGYMAEHIVGQSFERFYTPADVAAGRPAEDLRETTLHRRTDRQGWRLRRDGSLYWAEATLTALTAEDGRLRGFASVTRDRSERKRLESLEEQGRHLTEFLAMLAHELRNPLAPIRNAVAIMSMDAESSPQIAWCRDVIERQTGQLSRLVDDLLDVSRITRGKLRLKSAPMDLRGAVERAVEASRPLIDARAHQLELRLPDRDMPVHADMTRLTQVVLNLLNNAAKYTPEGGRIEIEGECAGQDCVLRVRDNGVGMPPDLVEQVFDLFAQGERTLDRSEGGLGIGLTLARRIVGLHGGTITARSEGVGKGSEFEVRLPRLNVNLTEAQAPAVEGARRAGFEKRSILVVDDNADAASSMAMLLRMVGHEVAIENDGPRALERAAASHPDIVLLDIGLPGIDGYEVARRLRTALHGERMRIYAMTGYGQEEDRRRSLAAGFDGHLVKPVMPAELLAVIDDFPEG